MVTASVRQPVDILVLGAGWTSTFLLPLLDRKEIPYAATTTTGRDGTIKFVFDPDSSDDAPYRILPQAKTVLITFPLKGIGQSTLITSLYQNTHSNPVKWMQLGSSSAFTSPHWNDNESPVDDQNERVKAEIELLKQGPNIVLNLAGLYGGTRQPKNWPPRIIKTKADLKNRKALHLVHGEDVARAVLAAHLNSDTLVGRWVVTDLHVYDWWDMIYEWGGQMQLEGETVLLREAVFDCMKETNVRALPRAAEHLGRVLDSTAFWSAIDSYPIVGRAH